MNDDTSRDTSETEPVTDWQRLRAVTEEEIRAAIAADLDIMPTDEAFWQDARIVHPASKGSRNDNRENR